MIRSTPRTFCVRKPGPGAQSSSRNSMAEADGNRTRQGPIRPLAGFEDRGTHQASGRLLDGQRSIGEALVEFPGGESPSA